MYHGRDAYVSVKNRFERQLQITPCITFAMLEEARSSTTCASKAGPDEAQRLSTWARFSSEQTVLYEGITMRLQGRLEKAAHPRTL